jgi:hypothetical protein
VTALRCKECDVNWPVDFGKYRACPGCLKPTRWDETVDPLSASEALSRQKHAEFDRHCAERDEAEAAKLTANLDQELDQILASAIEQTESD